MTDRSRTVVPLVPDTPATAELFGEIAARLWLERDVLEELLYALTQQQLVLSAGQTRWLPRADAAVQLAAREVQNHEVLRAAEVAMLTRDYALPADVSLRDLIDVAPDPWGMVLGDHRSALRSLTEEIETVTASVRAMLIAGERATRDALEQAGVVGRGTPASARYDARGGLNTGASSVFDEHA